MSTSPAARKLIVTIATVVAAVGVFLVVVNSKNNPTGVKPDAPTAEKSNGTGAAGAAGAPDATAAPTAPPEGGETNAAPGDAGQAAESTIGAAPAPTGLTARAPEGGFDGARQPSEIGSLDPRVHPFRIVFAPTGAGVESILFSEFWKTAQERIQASKHMAAGGTGEPPLPPESERYELTRAQPIFESGRAIPVPVLAVHSIEVDGSTVLLFGNVWSEVAPGRFVSEIVDEAGTPRFLVERIFETKPGSYDLILRQRVTNLGSTPSKVRWVQYGPGDLLGDPTTYIDVRRFHFGYLLPVARDANQEMVLATGQMFERGTVVKQISKGQFTLWPNADSESGGYTISWFGSTSRYFALCVHAPWEPGTSSSKALSESVEEVKVLLNGALPPADLVMSELHSPVRTVEPGAVASFDLGVYAGPLDPRILGVTQPYQGLGMRQLIVYMLSSCCSFCTFAWLANLLATFLAFLHDYVVFDWGLAIIVLVIVVRAILHPLMKRSQIQMQRFGRAMAELKPELDALQKRYKDDPTKMQAEQMRLYREKRINPVGCVGGLLPTFLQMPIWIALYAVLFFNFDLRQSPAFFGIFQQFGGWAFLGDLSRPDNFIAFSSPIDLWLFKLHGIFLLPILMGFVFYLQQKYMTPPTPNMSPEQEQQQKIMKWMMVVMFPVMLYPAPSGLTLYILTSTCIGIWESRMVKKHIESQGLADPKKADGQRSDGKKPEGKKRQDFMGRMYEEALERARKKQAEKNQRTFKERE